MLVSFEISQPLYLLFVRLRNSSRVSTMSVIVLFSHCFQLSELEQRVVEAETRAEDAEEKVRQQIPLS